ncbi:MAG: hypothetical protein HYX53_01455 [Chloroflexi bacterium]|nr:hypothetical protein [Chloroflexota bacterium]
MVMQDQQRSLTIEEAKRLAPTAEERAERLARHRAAMERIAELQKIWIERWGGPLSEEEFADIERQPGEGEEWSWDEVCPPE